MLVLNIGMTAERVQPAFDQHNLDNANSLQIQIRGQEKAFFMQYLVVLYAKFRTKLYLEEVIDGKVLITINIDLDSMKKALMLSKKTNINNTLEAIKSSKVLHEFGTFNHKTKIGIEKHLLVFYEEK